MRVLLLGGTSEARALAATLASADLQFVSSLAGRVSNSALPVGETRVGGFGGVAGLETYLHAEAITAVIDATHPFAATITANAAVATSAHAIPLLVLRRPGWSAEPDDRWTRVPDIVEAAQAAASAAAGTIFLTTGRRDLAAFAADAGHRYLVRTVDPPSGAQPPNVTLLLARGPYRVDGERLLMSEQGVILLVTKDSGGELTSEKLAATRELGVPVVMVDRPQLPSGVTVVATVPEAADWVRQLSSG